MALRYAQACARPALRGLGVRCESSATSALNYKASHRRPNPPPLPTIDPPSWSVPEAVSNIVYNTPLSPTTAPQVHVLNCLVQNEPGVLSRLSGILAARGFNIDSLVVCNTEVKDLSRMTIVLRGLDGVIEQARRQLEDLVPVWAVLDYTRTDIIQRELLLCKVSLLGPEHFHELLYSHKEEQNMESDELEIDVHEEAAAAADEPVDPILDVGERHPANLPPSEALRQKHAHLKAITDLAVNFGGRVVDISTNTAVVELCAKPSRVSSFITLLKPFGILEAARSGMMALPRTPLDSDEVEAPISEKVAVDVSDLPPG